MPASAQLSAALEKLPSVSRELKVMKDLSPMEDTFMFAESLDNVTESTAFSGKTRRLLEAPISDERPEPVKRSAKSWRKKQNIGRIEEGPTVWDARSSDTDTSLVNLSSSPLIGMAVVEPQAPHLSFPIDSQTSVSADSGINLKKWEIPPFMSAAPPPPPPGSDIFTAPSSALSYSRLSYAPTSPSYSPTSPTFTPPVTRSLSSLHVEGQVLEEIKFSPLKEELSETPTAAPSKSNVSTHVTAMLVTEKKKDLTGTDCTSEVLPGAGKKPPAPGRGRAGGAAEGKVRFMDTRVYECRKPSLETGMNAKKVFNSASADLDRHDRSGRSAARFRSLTSDSPTKQAPTPGAAPLLQRKSEEVLFRMSAPLGVSQHVHMSQIASASAEAAGTPAHQMREEVDEDDILVSYRKVT